MSDMLPRAVIAYILHVSRSMRSALETVHLNEYAMSTNLHSDLPRATQP
jgi:hypothetical protein